MSLCLSFNGLKATACPQVSLPVTELLRSAASCLEANVRALKSEPTQSSSFDPDSALIASRMDANSETDWIQTLQTSDPAQTVQTLRALADACQNQEERLQGELASLERQLCEAYSKDLQKQPYYLFGIWVHQGQQAEAKAGHYVAFLKDWREDRWMRFSDSFVSIVSWDEVRAAALGGETWNDGQNAKSRSSAYVLVYMEAALAESQQRECAAADEIIPAELLEEIKTDNRALQNERGSWQEQVKVRELCQHAQAIFQEYGGHLHHWNQKKPMGDASGNPHSQDPNHRKQLNDPVL